MKRMLSAMLTVLMVAVWFCACGTSVERVDYTIYQLGAKGESVEIDGKTVTYHSADALQFEFDVRVAEFSSKEAPERMTVHFGEKEVVFSYTESTHTQFSNSKNAGLKKLEEEIQDLKVNRRKEVAEKIKEAREQGDLSENAEYDAAKDEQREIELRIEEIDKILKNAEVVDEEEVGIDVISIGCVVKILDKEYKEELTYQIVGATEANTLKRKISNESPVGRALIGRKKGETVTVDTPAGQIKYKILQIDKVN